MPTIVVDANLHQRISQLTEPVDLVDASGNRLGRFVPAVTARAAWLESPFSEEELDRRERANEPRYTTAEVLKGWEKPS